MLVWFVETTVVALLLAASAALAGRCFKIGPVARHALWLVVLIKLVTPPIVSWPRPAWPSWAKPSDAARGPDVDVDVDQALAQALERTLHGSSEKSAVAEPLHGALATSWELPDRYQVEQGVVQFWSAASVLLALCQLFRIARFQRRLRRALPAPSALVDEVSRMSESLGVHPPEVLVLADLTTPLLWCLGRPRLVLPAELIHTLDHNAWRGILTHELAHLLRRDHWVRRLELIAGVLWWWNPLYWLTCVRLNAEAELACDEWAVRALPEQRFAYAEALLKVCQSLSKAAPPVPALGAAGAGRFLERRIVMILRGPSQGRTSSIAFFAAVLLALLALPSWTSASIPGAVLGSSTMAVVADQAQGGDVIAQDDDDDREDADDNENDRDDDDDDDDDERPSADKVKERARPQKPGTASNKETRSKKSADAAGDKAPRPKANKRRDAKDDDDTPQFAKDLEAMGEKLGEELEAMGERLGKELEEKMGPGSDFEKTLMEKLGPGSDFQKMLMEKLGPGSEFQKELMKNLGPGSKFEKEITEKFGPGSDFEKKLKESFGPGSEFQKKLGKFKADKGHKKSSDVAQEDKPKPGQKPKPGADKKASQRRQTAKQIKELQLQIEKLRKQLEDLEEQEQEDHDQ